MKKTLIVLALILIAFLRLLAQNPPIRIQTMTGNASNLVVTGNIEVTLLGGNEGFAVIEGQDSISCKSILVDTTGGILKITGNKDNDKLRVSVYGQYSAISLNGAGAIRTSGNAITAQNCSISLNGSGTIDCKIKSESVRASSNGSGNMMLSGNTVKCYLSANGTGNVDAKTLKVLSGVVNLTGSGSCHVNIEKKIEANILGSGNLTYLGEPEIIKNGMGKGKITPGK